MWGESSQNCESNCQCSGLITENFKINSGNNSTKRRREEAISNNFKYKMNPHSLDFTRLSPLSPKPTPSKRRVLGELQNSPLYLQNSPLQRTSPLTTKLTPLKKSPLLEQNSLSPLTSRCGKRSTTKINRIFEDRTKFKMDNKENDFINETFMKFEIEDETRDSAFSDSYQPKCGWSNTKLDFKDALQTKLDMGSEKETFVPEKETETLDSDFETLHDLEAEFDADNFDQCTKYEIVSTDSPDIISRGRTSSSRKVSSRNFVFGAPLSENEPSTSFNKPNAAATRVLNFEESFEFMSPPVKRSASNGSVKKSLKFNETPTKNCLRHESNDSSVSLTSPLSSNMRIFTSESTTSMESGFISELEEPFLEIEESSNSPKVANFNDLLSGQIKTSFTSDKGFSLRRPMLSRSISFNPESSKAKLSLLSILESPMEKKPQKRSEPLDSENIVNKRRKPDLSPLASETVSEPVTETAPKGLASRPVLQRCFSENNASIMSALARSDVDKDLIGDFSRLFSLPLTRGPHADLRSVDAHTLALLLRGHYNHLVDSYQIIDCRYPYEFAGGHVTGAVNLYRGAQLLPLLQAEQQQPGRRILIFHCELSHHRGPNLCRFFRSSDRAQNKEHYPSLNYPEIYLLHEGYKAFYSLYPELCTPNGYTAMLDPRHKESLRHHRSEPLPSTSAHHRRNRLLL